MDDRECFEYIKTRCKDYLQDFIEYDESLPYKHLYKVFTANNKLITYTELHSRYTGIYELGIEKYVEILDMQIEYEHVDGEEFDFMYRVYEDKNVTKSDKDRFVQHFFDLTKSSFIKDVNNENYSNCTEVHDEFIYEMARSKAFALTLLTGESEIAFVKRLVDEKKLDFYETFLRKN